jgi:hypothetical protein
MVEHVDVDVKIEIVRYEKNVFEYPTLIHLQTYCHPKTLIYILGDDAWNTSI